MSWTTFWHLYPIRQSEQSQTFDWPQARYQRVTGDYSSVRIEAIGTFDQGLLVFDSKDEILSVPIDDLKTALQRYQHTESQTEAIVPPFAALLYDATGDYRTLVEYFPLLSSRPDLIEERDAFFQRLDEMLNDSNLSIRVWDDAQRDEASVPPSMRAIVAGHILEVLFDRSDMVTAFLERERVINLYMNRKSYQKAGGVSGGCFDTSSGSIKLVASRLYEGFYGPTVGGSAFLHEFGHMFDAFQPAKGTVTSCRGLLPGLSPDDGAVFTPEARRDFLAGKRIEYERYQRCRNDPTYTDEIPIGHPYVFQNDREFVAGYLEMFFRNPHYFASLNPTLYNGFSLLFKQDPRQYWESDYMYYVQQNRKVYLNSERKLPPTGLTLTGADS